MTGQAAGFQAVSALDPVLVAAAGDAAGGVLFRRDLWGRADVGAVAVYLTRAVEPISQYVESIRVKG